MATISFSEFSKGQPVTVIGNEAHQSAPITQQQDQPSLGSKLLDTAKTAGSELSDIGSRVASKETGLTSAALQTGGTFGRAAMGAVGDAVTSIPGAQEAISIVAKPISEGMKKFSDWLSDKPEFQKAVTNETSNAIADILDKHPDIARNAQALNDIANAVLMVKGGVETVGKLVTTAGKTATTVKDVVSPVVKTVTKGITPDAESIMQRVARVSKGKQASFEQTAGESIGSYLDKRGIYGDIDQITTKLYENFQKSKQAADDALAKIQGTYRSPAVKTAIQELEGKVERTSAPGAPDSDFSRVKELAEKEKSQGLTMSEVNEVKRIYERRVRLDFIKSNAPEEITRATNVDNALRNWQFSEAEKAGLKNLPQINRETRLAKKLMDDLGKEYAGSAGNNAITLTDWMMLSGGDPASIAGFLVKKGLSNKKIQSFIAEKMSKNKEKIGVPEADFRNATQQSPQSQQILPESLSQSTPNLQQGKELPVRGHNVK